MATQTASADQSKNIRLKYRKGEGRPITFNFLLDSASHDISGYEFLFQVTEIKDGTVVFELSEDSGGGLTNGGALGALTVDPTDDNVDVDEKSYHWKLKIISPYKDTWFNGLFVVNNSPQEDTDADSIGVTLDIGDVVINVELVVAGFDVASLTDAQLQQLYLAMQTASSFDYELDFLIQ